MVCMVVKKTGVLRGAPRGAPRGCTKNPVVLNVFYFGVKATAGHDLSTDLSAHPGGAPLGIAFCRH